LPVSFAKTETGPQVSASSSEAQSAKLVGGPARPQAVCSFDLWGGPHREAFMKKIQTLVRPDSASGETALVELDGQDFGLVPRAATPVMIKFCCVYR
jgi:hypothetical protein